MRFAVPQFQALDYAVAFKRNSAAVAAIADYVANLQRFRLAVAIVNDDAIKLYRGVVHANLQEAIASGSVAYFNVVMVMLAINVGLAKINPVFCMSGWGKTNCHR